MYLIDTNIWLERLLDQQQAKIVGEFLATVPSEQLAMSDFTFHSIALALTRRQLFTALEHFVQDVFMHGNVGILALSPGDLSSVIKVMAEQQLDYDDAYQYVVADQYTLTLVSFDTDFDHTAHGRQTPVAILQQLRQKEITPPEMES
jgi:predicted nucleic acid-binding protein